MSSQECGGELYTWLMGKKVNSEKMGKRVVDQSGCPVGWHQLPPGEEIRKLG